MKQGLLTALGLLLLAVVLGTQVVSNAWMLLTEWVNFIPAQTSIWFFKPYEINQGSSNYWIYGEDRANYYYFSYTPQAPYRLIARRNRCAGFDKHDVRTWCTP